MSNKMLVGAIACLPLLIPHRLHGQAEVVFPEIPPSVLPPVRTEYRMEQDPMESRLFRTTSTRTQISLGGFWDFVTDAKGTGETLMYFERFPDPETALWVPGTWNAIARYWQYQGAAWFRRTFVVPRDGNVHFRFGGVFYRSKVWLDGNCIGEHEGGYTPFDFTVAGVKKGQHSVVVLVDNTLNDETLPKAGTDWFPYGGMVRAVYAELVPSVSIDRFHVIPTEINSERAGLQVKVFIKNQEPRPTDKKVQFVVDGRVLCSGVHRLAGGNQTVSLRAVLPAPRLWSPENPYLYGARVVLGEDEDDQFDRFGIRSLTTDGSAVLLNGKRIKLMGANHHDDHPDWGSALPPHIVRQDIEILKRMGANAVRGHYPASELFMDYCDQSGLFFMNEVPSWQYRPDQMANPVCKEKIKRQFDDMVNRDMNRPCVFSWSLGNEWREFQKSYDDIKELVDYARSVDTTHFITFITGGAHVDRSIDLVDIVCTNWAAYQWYWDPSFSDEDSENYPVSTVLSSEIAGVSVGQLMEIQKRFPDKPVILTEFGAASSQAGWHNWGNVKWSEEFQARNVWDSGKIALEQDWISGGCVWQFCDSRAVPTRMLGPRFRGWNAKGVVDAYRQPKMAFYRLQELFHGFPW